MSLLPDRQTCHCYQTGRHVNVTRQVLLLPDRQTCHCYQTGRHVTVTTIQKYYLTQQYVKLILFASYNVHVYGQLKVTIDLIQASFLLLSNLVISSPKLSTVDLLPISAFMLFPYSRLHANFFYFFLTRTQGIFYYSIQWGIVYNRGMRHRGTLSALNKLALPQSPLQATPLKCFVYIVNFFRKVCNTTCIIYQLIYIS